MMSSAPSVIDRLAEAAERFVSTRTEPEVLTGLETVLTELAGVERFAILRDGGRRDPHLLRRALVTYSIEVGSSRHILAILRLKAGCEFDGLCDRLVDFATYEAGRRLTARARRAAAS